MVIALVTGGAGFIGSHLVEDLVEKGYQVKVIDSLIKGKSATIQKLIDQGKVEFFEGDIKNRDSVDKAMKNVDYVFHTAGTHIINCGKSPEDAIECNVHGSYNVFKSALDNNVKRVIFSSSSSIYGEPKSLPMSEDSELNIVEPYAASKQMAEHLLKFLGTKGLKYNILRYFNVYGSRQAVHAYYTTVVIDFINKLMNDESPIINGKGDQSLDFTHVSDVVKGNIAAAESTVENEIFNIGTGQSTSIADLAKMIIKTLGKDIEPRFRDRKVLVTRKKADTIKAEKILGFKSQVSIEEGIAKITKEIAENPELYKGR